MLHGSVTTSLVLWISTRLGAIQRNQAAFDVVLLVATLLIKLSCTMLHNMD